MTIPNLGAIVPVMGITTRRRRASRQRPVIGLADALFTKVQQRVIGVLFGDTSRSYYTNEIIRLAKTGTGAVQRELSRLESSGLVTSERVGNQKHYRANIHSPLFQELRTMVLKTFGLADVLRDALRSVAAEIVVAFVYGSVAKASDHAHSDIDVMVVSDGLSYSEVCALLEPAAATLGRSVSPTLYTTSDYQAPANRRKSFLARVLEQPRIWLIGGEHESRA